VTTITWGPTPHHPVQVDGPPPAWRLLVVDDHSAVRAGLRQLLENQADFAVVAAVASAEEALSVAEREPIDVAVVDYQLGGRNGLWVSRKLKRLSQPPAVLIYSAYTDGMLASAAVVAEADGIVSKGSRGSDLCEAIRGVARGHHLLPPVPSWLGEVLRRRLDHEEQAIFGLLLAGIKPTEIAHTLELSEAGLESRLWAMLRKVEAPERARQVEGAGRTGACGPMRAVPDR
jgi:DNA-binding NarL/FixJ family response regulator